MSVTSNDFVLSNYGGSVTFTGAYALLSPTDWNFVGISFGILGHDSY